MSENKYEKFGASASKAGLHKALVEAGTHSSEPYFATLASDLSGDPNYRSFNHCDGAGTKSIVAYLNFIESKDPKSFSPLAHDALGMNLDDVYCLGIPEHMILANVLNRNASIIPDSAISAIVGEYKKITDKLTSLGIPIELCGGETADCGDVTRTLAVDGALAGRIKLSSLVNPDNVKPGDVIVGLSSTGQASYEEVENSGIGSNGLTLARHSMIHSSYATEHPEILNPAVTDGYQGPFKLTDTSEGLGMTVGEALSSPTRTYAPVLKKIFESHFPSVHSAIHVSGGGLTKVLRFGKGVRYVKNDLFPTPPLFALIQESGDVSWEEMYKVFNMGCRLELYVEESIADSIIFNF